MKLLLNHTGVQMHEQDYRGINTRFLTVQGKENLMLFVLGNDGKSWGFVGNRTGQPAQVVLDLFRELVAKAEGRV